jgi:hypothetical protein
MHQPGLIDGLGPDGSLTSLHCEVRVYRILFNHRPRCRLESHRGRGFEVVPGKNHGLWSGTVSPCWCGNENLQSQGVCRSPGGIQACRLGDTCFIPSSDSLWFSTRRSFDSPEPVFYKHLLTSVLLRGSILVRYDPGAHIRNVKLTFSTGHG